MKTKSKALLLTLCAVLLVAASVLGTMAYLTDNDTVTNTFTVGNVKLGGENEKGLDEAKVDENGMPVFKDDGTTLEDRVQANTYKLQPGHTYMKDPTVHVGDDSDACYLFVKVENGIANIEAATEQDEDGYKNIAAQMEAQGWKALGEGYENIWVYIGIGADAKDPVAVEAKTDVVVFEQFKIADTVNNDTLKNYSNTNITVTAYAVQTDGFGGKTAVEIWNTAFASTTPGGSTTGGSEAGDGGIADA